jgi:PRTRC genetic system protein C
MTRIFKYQDNSFHDPGEEYSVEDVRRALAATFPDIAQATTTSRTLEDGTEEITFVKRSGTKGTEDIQRPVVKAFANFMEIRLRANDHKGGWEDVDPLWLLGRLQENVADLAAELNEESCDPDLAFEAATDVANYAMMIADVLCRLDD